MAKLTPDVIGRPPDDHYRAPAKDKEALRAREQLAVAPSVAAPVDSITIERQSRYLEALQALRARHGLGHLEKGAENAAFESERFALKQRMLGAN